MKDPLAVETRIEPRRAVMYAALVLATVLLLITLKPSVLGTIAVILAFFAMIMLHEFGHYITAKRTGMKVTEFFVGFGPRIWSITRGETEYGIKALPFGGYCKIVGMNNLEDVATEDEPRTYRSKSYPQRVLVASAGSITHFLIAFFLMFAVLGFGKLAKPTTTIGSIENGRPAAAAGIKPDDRLVSIAGQPIEKWDDVRKIIEKRGGQTLPFVVQRGEQTQTFDVTLAKVTDTGEKRGFAGIGSKAVYTRMSLGRAAVQTPKAVWDTAFESVRALGSMFSPHGVTNYVGSLQGDKNANSDQRFVSVIGVTRVANQAVNAGWVDVFGLLIAINVFVGLFNLVPLLPFDGGLIAIATYERVASAVKHRRVEVDVAKLIPLTVAVLGVLGFIMLSSIYMDISHPLKNPF